MFFTFLLFIGLSYVRHLLAKWLMSFCVPFGTFVLILCFYRF